jgi:tubulin polyglutamylase TTLL4
MMRVLKMRPSGFKLLPSTVYFDYPAGIGVPERVDAAIEEPIGKRKLHYETHWERNCIKNAFARAGFSRSMKQWTALWTPHQSKDVLRAMTCLQKVNHFPSSWCIGRKDRLMQTIGFMARLHGKEHFGFHPDGFVLPQEADALRRCLDAHPPGASGAVSFKSVAISHFSIYHTKSTLFAKTLGWQFMDMQTGCI